MTLKDIINITYFLPRTYFDDGKKLHGPVYKKCILYNYIIFCIFYINTCKNDKNLPVA